MAEPFVLRQEPIGESLEAVSPTLTEAFVAVREAVEAGRPVVVVVAGADLLGQGASADAAVATGLLGMVRTFAIEGTKPGWSVTLLAAREGHGEATGPAIAMLAASGLSGQVIELGTAHLGKVVP